MFAIDAHLYDATEDEDFPAAAACTVSISRRQVSAHIHSLPRHFSSWHFTLAVATVTTAFALHRPLFYFKNVNISGRQQT